MPKGTGHLEQLMHARLRQRSATTRRRAVAQIRPRLQPGGANIVASMAPGLGPAVGVDLRSATPVAEQIERRVPIAGFKPPVILPVQGNGATARAVKPAAARHSRASSCG